MSEVIVIGAGLAGLTAALRLRQENHSVTLLTKGIGGLQLGQGTLDVLGYAGPRRVERPLEEMAAFVAEHPEHPYAVLGRGPVERGIDWLRTVLGEEQLVGEADTNRLYPTAVGAIRPTALVPPSMAAGELVLGKKLLVVGVRELKDFPAALVAGNLARTPLAGGSVEARAETISFKAFGTGVDFSALAMARALDEPVRRRELVAALKPLVREGESVGLPAILGANDATAWRDIAEQLGAPVFEIPLPPPSVPGWRQNEALVQAVKDARVRLVNGTRVLRSRVQDGRVKGVTIKGTGREVEYTADHFVLATGGFESGALVLDSHNELHESVFGLPVRGGRIDDLVHGDYWGADQPLFAAGLAVDDRMRPLDADGAAVHPNLHACGGILAGAQRWSEKSGEGIALGSAMCAAEAVLADLEEK
ncbi:glycerol-3-phosphate dehydrogenase subunit GlpB [Luteococcus sp.]|uniref:glycerol-3-phosphate dehydrogenase subunit GlpB n=1 Tax=Luteococcus sp. TaxID=1969402 RepID=UPI0037354FD4